MSRKVALIGIVLVALTALALAAPAAPAVAQRQATYTPYPTYTALPTYTVPPVGSPEPRATEAIPTPRAPATPVPPGGGRTYDDQFILGRTFTLKSGDTIDGSLTVIGGNATLEPGSRVTGDVLVIGGNLTAAAELRGDLTVLGGNVVLDNGAVVGGTVALVGGNLELLDGAVVDEDVVVTGGSLDRQPGAVVRGEVREEAGRWAWPGVWPRYRFGNWDWAGPFGRLFSGLSTGVALALIGVLLALIWPQGLQRTGAALLAYPALSLGVGLLTAIVWALAMAVLAVISALLIITIVLACLGLPGVAIVALMGLVWAAASLLGWIALGVLIGERILRALNARQITPALSALVGVFVLTFLARLIDGIWCIGWLTNTALSLVGLGAVILTRFGTRPYLGGPPDASWRRYPAPLPPAAPIYPPRGPAAAGDVPGASVPATSDEPVLTPVVIDMPPAGEPPATEPPATEPPAAVPPGEVVPPPVEPREEPGEAPGPDRGDAPIVPPAPG